MIKEQSAAKASMHAAAQQTRRRSPETHTVPRLGLQDHQPPSTLKTKRAARIDEVAVYSQLCLLRFSLTCFVFPRSNRSEIIVQFI